MIFKSKIFRRILIAYLTVTLVPMIIASFIALYYGRIEIRDQTFRQLQIMADGAEAQVLDYLNYLKIQTLGYSASKPIIYGLKKYYRHHGDNYSVRDLNRHLTSHLKNFPECVEMFVLDVNGRVIASSDASNTGNDLSETDYFLNGRKAVYLGNIFREEETDRITWLVSCPVMEARGNNKLLAVLVSRINPVTLSDITTERKIRALGAKSQALRIGKTGETYIVNRDNLMITDSRFLDNVILKQAVDTEVVRRTRKVGETKAANYPDYRGRPVDGASMVIWETGWIIISETDYKESVIPFQRLLRLHLIGIGVLIPLIFLLSRRFIRPIMRLVQADREIMQGDPSRAFISNREIPADELGEVMHRRNIMLTSLKENAKELLRQSEELQTIIDASPAWIFYKDKENRFIRVNKALADATGLPKEAIEGKTTFEIYPHYAEKYWEDDKEVISSGQPKTNIIEPVVLKDSTRWVQTDKIPYRDEKGYIVGIIGFALDITERKQAEEKNRKLSMAIEQSVNIIFITDISGNIEYVNPRFEQVTGYSQEEVIGQNTHILNSKETANVVFKEMRRDILAGKTWRGTLKNRKKDGTFYWCNCINSAIVNEQGVPINFICVQEDVTEKMQLQEDAGKFTTLSTFDPLTGIYNRERFTELMNDWMAYARKQGYIGILLLVDIDKFRFVNDAYGIRTGDNVLRRMAGLLKQTMTDIDMQYYSTAGAEKEIMESLLCRMGGDEFAVFLPSRNENEGLKTAEQLRNTVASYQFEEIPGHITVSIGTVSYPVYGDTMQDLLKKADAAIYQAKELGRNCVHLYHAEDLILEKIHTRMEQKGHIQKAIKEDRFEPWFQPILGIRGGAVGHYEALARMRDEQGNVVSPALFIDTAEAFGLISSIDMMIIRKSMHLQSQMRKKGKQISISMNLSGKEMGSKELLSFIMETASETKAAPDSLVFEITETAAIGEFDKAKSFVSHLRSLGFKFSLDDFGVGFTSFRYLQEIEVDYIKIDGSFVKKLTESRNDRLFVKSIVDVAQGMGIKTVAEFVENQATLEILKEYGVDYAQGYFIGKPAPEIV